MSTELVLVLVIEDDGSIRHSVRVILQAEGDEVWEAATGNHGMCEITARKPDLVLLDLGLPNMDGVAVISHPRQWSEIPIIVLTARSDEMQKISAEDAGADDYLTKPFGSAKHRRQPVHLTPIEYRLLAALARNAGKVLTHNQLLREAWGAGYRIGRTFFAFTWATSRRSSKTNRRDPGISRPKRASATGLSYNVIYNLQETLGI